MREDINALGLSAQDVNVKRCTHFAPRVVYAKVTIKVITIEVQKVIIFVIIIPVKGAAYGRKRQQENYGLL